MHTHTHTHTYIYIFIHNITFLVNCKYFLINAPLIVRVMSEQMRLKGSCRPARRGQKRDWNFWNISVERHRANLWGQTRMEKCSSLCGTNPVVQITGIELVFISHPRSLNGFQTTLLSNNHW